MNTFKTLKALKAEVSTLYRKAVTQARTDGYKHTRSRGTAFLFCNANGRCDSPNCDPMEWTGTAKMLAEVIEEAKTIADCTHVVLEGGLDGFDTFAAMVEPGGTFDYEPECAYYELTVWTKDDPTPKVGGDGPQGLKDRLALAFI